MNKAVRFSNKVVVTISDKHNQDNSNSPFSEQTESFSEEIKKDNDKYNIF